MKTSQMFYNACCAVYNSPLYTASHSGTEMSALICVKNAELAYQCLSVVSAMIMSNLKVNIFVAGPAYKAVETLVRGLPMYCSLIAKSVPLAFAENPPSADYAIFDDKQAADEYSKNHSGALVTLVNGEEAVVCEELERLTINVHESYSSAKPVLVSQEVLQNELEDDYNKMSSMFNALHLFYKLYSLGITYSGDGDLLNAACKMLELEKKRDGSMVMQLVDQERRRWLLEKAFAGWRLPTDDELENAFTPGWGADFKNKKLKVHHCLAGSRPDAPMLPRDLDFWRGYSEGDSRYDKYDDIDRMSLKLHKICEKKVNSWADGKSLEEWVRQQLIGISQDAADVKGILEALQRTLHGAISEAGAFNAAFAMNKTQLAELLPGDILENMRMAALLSYEYASFRDYKQNGDENSAKTIPYTLVNRKYHTLIVKELSDANDTNIMSLTRLCPDKAIYLYSGENEPAEITWIKRYIADRHMKTELFSWRITSADKIDEYLAGRKKLGYVFDITGARSAVISSVIRTGIPHFYTEGGMLRNGSGCEGIEAFNAVARTVSVRQAFTAAGSECDSSIWALSRFGNVIKAGKALWPIYAKDPDSFNQAIRLLEGDGEPESKAVIKAGALAMSNVEKRMSVARYAAFAGVMEKMNIAGVIEGLSVQLDGLNVLVSYRAGEEAKNALLDMLNSDIEQANYTFKQGSPADPQQRYNLIRFSQHYRRNLDTKTGEFLDMAYSEAVSQVLADFRSAGILNYPGDKTPVKAVRNVGNILEVDFTNIAGRMIFRKQGNFLELLVYTACLSCGKFESVELGWTVKTAQNVTNEVDVVAMDRHNNLFLFSCKSGKLKAITKNASLNELSVEMRKFGINRATGVLVCPAYRADEVLTENAFSNRAAESKIFIMGAKDIFGNDNSSLVSQSICRIVDKINEE